MTNTAIDRSRLADVPAGATAYVDADWFGPDGELLEAVIVEDDGVHFLTGPSAMAQGDRDLLGGAVLERIATRVVEATRARNLVDVVVPGRGLLATQVRQLLGDGSTDTSGGSPACIVDTTGSPEVVTDLLSSLENLGALVAAGPVAGRTFPLNVYSDIHARGLHVIGIPYDVDANQPQIHAQLAWPAPSRDADRSVGATWYRIDV
jgi:hypothetical protein